MLDRCIAGHAHGTELVLGGNRQAQQHGRAVLAHDDAAEAEVAMGRPGTVHRRQTFRNGPNTTHQFGV